LLLVWRKTANQAGVGRSRVPRAMVIGNNDAITVEVAKGCCCSNIEILRFFELPAQVTGLRSGEKCKNIAGRYFGTVTAV